ncbi:MAG: peroxiredoxin, partial [Pseudobdellovibrionaceae bacterium]
YPRTGEPSKPAPPDWDLIPGARGCTPQSCGFRDLYREFQSLGFQVFGLSSQDTDYQKEFVNRNHIPFEILSDAEFALTDSLRLPTFVYNGMRLIKRMAWVIEDGKITKVFYPVFPPTENAATVLAWLRSQ